MPNTGKPSQDCHLCRKRRVKCDLARPGCQRCVKYGVECPGYRDQAELVFRNADPSTVRKRKKRAAEHDDAQSSRSASPGSVSATGSGAGSRPESGSSTPSFSASADDLDTPFIFSAECKDLVPTSKSAPWPSYQVAVPKSMAEHWTSHSVPILLNVYSTLDFLNNTYQQNPRDGPLVWAAHLFSRTYVTNIRYPTAIYRSSELETQRELGTYLGKTLSSVAAALKDPKGAFRDDVLATVWILSNYELLVGSLSRMEPLSPWHLHARGLYSILKTRGTAPLYTSDGRTAFWPSYNMVQVQALVSNTECPPESDEWLGIVRDNLYEGEASTLCVSVFVVKCAHVQARIFTILSTRDFGAAEAEYRELVDEMDLADAEFVQSAAGLHDTAHELDAYMRNLYHSAVVKGYHYIQLMANFLTHYAPSTLTLEELRARRDACLEKTQLAAQEILDSVPWILGPLASGKDKSPKVLFDALKMVWPLTSVYVVSTTLPEQRVQAEVALVFIGKEVGVRQALKTYPAGLALPPESQRPLETAAYDGASWAAAG
ncbi:N-terminal fungal transcription regulatory domain-containing protein [Purpureocillium lilacinum]|uniref:N-terminal fungal transcription regulatory domain-containing protein n=1 Tax=Purpureocillium lilacinum TaxID=33203 RepID=A0A179HQQ4_PURLI|nr:N-terminal fungal transcription regulatory domain-containing protein [Purpureocillium lilacinum]OAQ91750.1 N-terminal fungal transcription regulatory domain-containing protein [Purpureocillium lilacinum]